MPRRSTSSGKSGFQQLKRVCTEIGLYPGQRCNIHGFFCTLLSLCFAVEGFTELKTWIVRSGMWARCCKAAQPVWEHPPVEYLLATDYLQGCAAYLILKVRHCSNISRTLY
ncbi:hypothetical protein NEOLEDRAFT_654050 [Neolentinus lepideus HHB14362 ss-1]|uniref:Uncharacterized protein n=1 Tax=Neolentinus lepideus HHB14362 ss-1 TaxID=1314782 RepID=A0A165QK30_9AGAM|nr:hypothetical protein NEOLEDRAFT_654050 [Neolentinus lepideus HHB14362 ss-1]